MSKSKRHLIGLADILKQADALQRGMPVSYLLAFVLVAADEGEGVLEYAARAGVDRFAMSHSLNVLGKNGYGWLEAKRVGKRRSVTLTLKGHAVLSRFSQALSGS